MPGDAAEKEHEECCLGLASTQWPGDLHPVKTSLHPFLGFQLNYQICSQALAASSFQTIDCWCHSCFRMKHIVLRQALLPVIDCDAEALLQRGWTWSWIGTAGPHYNGGVLTLRWPSSQGHACPITSR